MFELHTAACNGLADHVGALLSRGSVDIDQRGPNGFTPLMIAAGAGHVRIVKMLVNKGANVSYVGGAGGTALHGSAQGGHVAVAKLLVNAGADLEVAAPSGGSTPLHMAAENGHTAVVDLLIEAGANPNSRAAYGLTPLHKAAFNGHVSSIKLLVRAGANALLTYSRPKTLTRVALDFASQEGHVKVVRQLIEEYGIEGCAGASGGLDALQLAARDEHVDIMAVLRDAGVFDTGQVLHLAAERRLEASVKFLLQQKDIPGSGGIAFFGFLERLLGRTPLLCAIDGTSPRIVRMLVDAGADTASPVGLTKPDGTVAFSVNPLTYASVMLRDKTVRANAATEEQLFSLKAIQRLLFRVEAVRAESWLWASDVPSPTSAAAERTKKITTTSTSLTSMLPILRRRAQRTTLLSTALFRISKKL